MLGEIVQEWVSPLEANASDAQKAAHKEQMKKDGKTLFLIHQCVVPNIFEKIIKEESTKEACDELNKLYGGDEKLKRVKLQTLRKQLEMTQMKDDKSISKLFSRMCC